MEVQEVPFFPLILVVATLKFQQQNFCQHCSRGSKIKQQIDTSQTNKTSKSEYFLNYHYGF